MPISEEGRMPMTPRVRAAVETSAADAEPREEAAVARFAPPVFILAPPRSYSSLVCSMLGQHPQMFGLPELHLFGSETIGAWWKAGARATFPRQHGVLRAIAELFYGGQTEENVQQARGWLRRRSHMSPGLVLELLAERVYPRIPVEKSPSITYSIRHMKRANAMFPGARYLHLLRHPRTQAESMLQVLERQRERGVLVARYWADPPLGWFANHSHIRTFLEEVPPAHAMRVRAEDLLADPDAVLTAMVRWLGVRDDAEAIEAMKHPEASPFSRLGPPGAMYGADRKFLESPEFRPGAAAPANLQDPVSWRSDGAGLPPRVKELAQEFGYA